MNSDNFDALFDKIGSLNAVVGIVGLGYVGLPLAAACGLAGYKTIGFDIDPEKVTAIHDNRSYIGAVSNETVEELRGRAVLEATTDFARLAETDIIVICVPTPLTAHREPDTSFIKKTAEQVARTLRPGQLVVLESTTYPGTTRDLVRPILEQNGLVPEVDFFLGYSPEREDPGNASFATRSIPKIVSGDGSNALTLVSAFYGSVVSTIVPVGSMEVAEAAKLTENIFRAVNIALVNELKIVFSAMGIDVWEVIEAAKSKPFGFMPFYPGPGLGGHCIPIDPFYLTWASRAHEVPTRFIELAGEINVQMPLYVQRQLEQALDKYANRALGASRVLIIGLAYKKNVSDIRESPSLRLMELLEGRGTTVDFHDPFVGVVSTTRRHGSLEGKSSVPLTPESVAGYDAVLVATDHDAVDYEMIARYARIVVDTRNVMARRRLSPRHLVKA